jgi:transcriptional regulator with XRE-family HTH domain
MDGASLRRLREERGMSQAQAASRLGVSQPYLSLLEAGDRPVTSRLARRYLATFGLSPSHLQPPESTDAWGAVEADVLAKHVAALGYAPFAYLSTRAKPENPAAVLVWALGASSLEPRLVEALPWLLLRFDDLDLDWLVREAKLHDLQNRLGFLATLAAEVAKRGGPFEHRRDSLDKLCAVLEPSRLAREDTLCDETMSAKMREWARKSRSAAARHWNLLTTWNADQLRYEE